MSKPYQEDLAYIHDVGYGHFVNGSAPGLLQLLSRSKIHEGLVIDLEAKRSAKQSCQK
ncbi:MAG: hypothetical protein IH991_24530 [Planctomycetes bacterium]|nr:hypothetical protein [Planctomycetota bacterium]